MKNKEVKIADLKPFKSYGISRVDQEEKSNHGWTVRVKGFQQKWFADRKCGSRKKALASAIVLRDTLFQKLSDKDKVRASKKTPKSRGTLA